jgi:hypothetical protein
VLINDDFKCAFDKICCVFPLSWYSIGLLIVFAIKEWEVR